MWFEELMGFPERNPDVVRNNIVVDGDHLTSKVSGKSYQFGRLEIPTLDELRDAVRSVKPLRPAALCVREVVADVQSLHLDPSNAGAIFQVASQFNLLEMASPNLTPEDGVTLYENDYTQGPACAIAAGAGTIYRNYFLPLKTQGGTQIGQSADFQIDCLAGIGRLIGNIDNSLWRMQNGYAFPTGDSLGRVTEIIEALREEKRTLLQGALQIGLQLDTQVTLLGMKHTVAQAYCSALPVAYSGLPPEMWRSFALLILEAAYEATLCAAIVNRERTGNNRLYLTLLGGGAFGNDPEWIYSSLRKVINEYRSFDLDIRIVSYGRPNPRLQSLVTG